MPALRPAEREPNITLVVAAGVMGAMFLAAIEATVAATALPTVVSSLGGIRIYSWAFSAFLLAATITTPIWGRLTDHLGAGAPISEDWPSSCSARRCRARRRA